MYTLMFSKDEIELIVSALEHAVIWESRQLLKSELEIDKIQAYIADEIKLHDTNMALMKAGLKK